MFSTIPLCIVLYCWDIQQYQVKTTKIYDNDIVMLRMLMFIKLEAEKCKFIRGNFLIYVNIKLQVY